MKKRYKVYKADVVPKNVSLLPERGRVIGLRVCPANDADAPNQWIDPPLTKGQVLIDGEVVSKDILFPKILGRAD